MRLSLFFISIQLTAIPKHSLLIAVLVTLQGKNVHLKYNQCFPLMPKSRRGRKALMARFLCDVSYWNKKKVSVSFPRRVSLSTRVYHSCVCSFGRRLQSRRRSTRWTRPTSAREWRPWTSETFARTRPQTSSSADLRHSRGEPSTRSVTAGR